MPGPDKICAVCGRRFQWRRLMEPARRAARRLAHRGSIQILQDGRPVDASSFKGRVRLKRRRESNRSAN
jgi:hypothetical protein